MRPRVRLLAALALVVSACRGDAGPRAPERRRQADERPSSEPAPRAELLLEAGDSTYWVHSGPEGVRLRGSPILLARLGGRFQELYVVDDDHSFYDAVFVGQQLWRRDLVSGDSVALVGDTLVHQVARRWAHRHPDAEPLDPEDDESDDPASSATGDIEVLDVLGPWATIQRTIDIDVEGEAHYHTLRWEVLDLRTGRSATLGTIVGDAAARTAVAAARASYAVMLDSVRRARDERGRRAASAIASFPFDTTSFGLSAEDGAPVVTFLVPGHGEKGGGYVLRLPPVPVPPPAWWGDVAGALPRASGDTLRRRQLGALTVEASGDADDPALRLVLRDSAGRQWVAGRVQPPLRWALRLDDAAPDSVSRQALARAFDESALYSDEARTASRTPRGNRATARLVPVARRLTSPHSTHARPAAGGRRHRTT